MIWLYVGFIAFILVMLFIDLKVVNRDAHEIRPRESLMFTGVVVMMALGFAAAVFAMYQYDWPAGIAHTLAESLKQDGPKAEAEASAVGLGFEAMALYLTAWVLEYSLSVDNLFVIAVIFSHFGVPAKYQHRVLFWGILGALILRGLMIAAGAALVKQFAWIDYVFGSFLLFTAFKMLRAGDEHHDPEKSIAVRLTRRIFPMSKEFHGERFFVRLDGRLLATPLLLVLVTVEFTDVVFAVDSIPAVFSVTKDPFLVFTSNVFAILGLRSLYFAVAAALGSFRYLKVSLVFVLAYIGLKMILHEWYEPKPLISLSIVLGILAGGVLASIFASKKEREHKKAPIDDLAEALEIGRRNFRRALILIVGVTVILFGLAIGFLPGPGPVIIVPIGLAILGTEFAWAQIVQRKLKREALRLTNAADSVAARTSPWMVPPVILFVGAGLILLAHQGPFEPRMVYLASLGIWIPILYWTWKTIAAARRTPSAPLSPPPPTTTPTPAPSPPPAASGPKSGRTTSGASDRAQNGDSPGHRSPPVAEQSPPGA